MAFLSRERLRPVRLQNAAPRRELLWTTNAAVRGSFFLRGHRMTAGRGNIMIDDEEAREINRRHQDGETMTAIALEYGCSRETIANAIRRIGGEPISRPARKPLKSGPTDVTKRRVKMVKAGMPVAEIAKREGVTTQAIRSSMRRWEEYQETSKK